MAKETRRHREAFETYYNMEKPSLLEVAKKFNVSVQAVFMWNKKFGWQHRFEERQVQEQTQVDLELAKRGAKARLKHAQVGVLLQAKGVEILQNEETRLNVDQAIKAVSEGVRIEREAEGLNAPIIIGEQVQNNNIAMLIQETSKNGDKGTVISVLERILEDVLKGRIGKGHTDSALSLPKS